MTVAEALRPLPPVAARVDAELARMDGEIDWLLALSPVHNDALWRDFEASGRREIGELEYHALPADLPALRERLLALPVEAIEQESALLAALLSEKQRELERQLALVRLRGTDGFINASLDLFGGVEPPLLALAERILADVGPGAPLAPEADLPEILEAVERELDWYRARAERFRCDVVVDRDLGSLMMVSHGTFYLAGDLRLPRARVQPLIQHEIGTHVLTRHNGRQQPLRQLEVGLAHYDPLQEGLGVLSEYLAGYLPGERLRVLAARVVATAMALEGEDVPAIFARLHEEHGLATDDAFDTAVRARRGGGLTKDAVYLRGLRDLVDHLRGDGDFESLYMGKFALSHLPVLRQLVEQGWALPPELLPRWLEAPQAAARLAECRRRPVESLFHHAPATASAAAPTQDIPT